MKKLILCFLFLLLGIVGKAQFKEDVITEPQREQVMMTQEQFNTISLLKKENQLLNQRTIASILTLSGATLMVTGYTLNGLTYTVDSNGSRSSTSKGGLAMFIIGDVVMTTGAIWLIVNNFQLIHTRKQINENYILEINPTGIKINF